MTGVSMYFYNTLCIYNVLQIFLWLTQNNKWPSPKLSSAELWTSNCIGIIYTYIAQKLFLLKSQRGIFCESQLQLSWLKICLCNQKFFFLLFRTKDFWCNTVIFEFWFLIFSDFWNLVRMDSFDSFLCRFLLSFNISSDLIIQRLFNVQPTK